jgi:hypothetical protein
VDVSPPRRLGLGLLVLLAGCHGEPGGRAEPEVVLLSNGRAPEGAASSVEVRHLDRGLLRRLSRVPPNDSAWRGAFSVIVDGATRGRSDAAEAVPVALGAAGQGRSGSLPQVIGRYEVHGDGLHFIPKFPLAPGVAYDVRVDLAALGALAGTASQSGGVIARRLALPSREERRTTRIQAVHPARDTLPENLLRWYVELSAPMAPGEALSHVHLIDEAGREVLGAFLQLDEELWDPAHRRLTLLFDPGRVKRGVRTNLESGAPLIAGRRYRLTIDAAWPDGSGARLASGFDHAFYAGPADRTSPSVERWTISPPEAGTRRPLGVAFGEALDHALASRMIAVRDSSGRRVDGTVALDTRDERWSFTPLSAWAPGRYELRVDARLEDVAGNNLARVFDADRRGGAPPVETAEGTSPERTRVFTIPSR